MMKVVETKIEGVLLLESELHADERGWFFEAYNARSFRQATGVDVEFVQDNHSWSGKNVLRGLHYQVGCPQGKLLRVLRGEIFDVVIDIRRDSPTLGKWVSANLGEKPNQAIWIPAGFAHGYLVLSDFAEIMYKVTDFYSPPTERTIIWSDPDLGIIWPSATRPIVSDKDRRGIPFRDAESYN